MAPAYMSYIGPRLRKARLAAGMTQREAGEALGTDETNISRYENAKATIGLGMAYKFSVLYDVPLGYLFPRSHISEDPSSEDLALDEIIIKIESLGPLYIEFLSEVVSAFEKHKKEKGFDYISHLIEKNKTDSIKG